MFDLVWHWRWCGQTAFSSVAVGIGNEHPDPTLPMGLHCSIGRPGRTGPKPLSCDSLSTPNHLIVRVRVAITVQFSPGYH